MHSDVSLQQYKYMKEDNAWNNNFHILLAVTDLSGGLVS
jgi:hypothetical protein